MRERITCDLCGEEITREPHIVEGRQLCQSCYDFDTFRCDCCGTRILVANEVRGDHISICEDCYENHYHRCERCDTLVHDSDVFWDDDTPYCRSCYEEITDNCIKDYYYKPMPVFYKRPTEGRVRYYGVELEIDGGGKDDNNAESLYNTANQHSDVLYIKSDSSLEEGMELVSHPCSVEYHKQSFPWKEVMKDAVRLGYRSHNTCTCGLHIHIGRDDLGETVDAQEEVISRIMFFFESHWNEIFRFSRRAEYSVRRWASRYGYKDSPKEILEDAKKASKGRYTCVNITNSSTVEIRIFKGTLKWNTFIAAIELVDAICENALRLSDERIHKQSWNDFVMSIDPDYVELVKYLKEKRLYVNDPVEVEEEV
ncbi:MAG: amidoligase family protein [Clostridia bacterium]|nr:amidoligase family protein [Clostridia bacterium]